MKDGTIVTEVKHSNYMRRNMEAIHRQIESQARLVVAAVDRKTEFE